ncbi:putative B3 domain-containing protein At5g35780 [Mangifera indica]|uniref:putative B3 domain-containing protein At5g35780 n=1 Tax=Mangifera indica TaxID=29780 RepID=UPI001CFAD634|nr:putative B3 domain-containing protein At5g35780 [Mangifera indica]
MFSEDMMESDSSESSTEHISDEASQSELSELEILKGFHKRARKDPEVAKLKRKLEFYERTGTTLGFFLLSLPVPRKKRSVIITQKDKGIDSSEQDTRCFKWMKPIVCDIGSTSNQGKLDKDKEKKEERKERRRKGSRKKMKVPVPRQLVPEVEEEPPMPERLRAIVEEKNGLDITFVMQKALTSTDLAQQNNRLSLPRKQVKNHNFLTNEENDILDAKTHNAISIELITPSGNPVELTLKKWRMNSTFVYNFIGAWFKKVVNDKSNGLEVGKKVRLWSFRRTSKLSFVLDCN